MIGVHLFMYVCYDRSLFKKFEDAADEEVVLMENQNTAKVLGRGTVEL